jgi:hypothetical protein
VCARSEEQGSVAACVFRDPLERPAGVPASKSENRSGRAAGRFPPSDQNRNGTQESADSGEPAPTMEDRLDPPARRLRGPGEGDIVERRRWWPFVSGTARRGCAREPHPARHPTLSRHLLGQIEALELPRLDTTLSEAVL